MTQPVLKLNTIDEFVAYTQGIDFGAFRDAVFVAHGEVTGTFNDASTDVVSNLATLN